MINKEEIIPEIKIEIVHWCGSERVETLFSRITVNEYCLQIDVEVKDGDRLGAMIEILEKSKIRALQRCAINQL